MAAEVNKKNYSTGGGQIMIEGRRVVGKDKRIQCDCCLQPTHLLVNYPILYPREYVSPSSTQNMRLGLISTHRNYINASISFSLHLKWDP